VNPVDDMHADNPPVMPDLLATLAEQFRLNNYDTRYVVRAICGSEAYQRSSRAGDEGETPDPDLYVRRAVRVLSPEQLFDSVTQILGEAPRTEAKQPLAKKGPLQNPRQNFINFFRVEDANPLEYQVGIPQALRLMNSVQMNRTDSAITAATRHGRQPAQVVEQLYLMTVSRPPTVQELQRMEAFVSKNGDNLRTYGDVLWALLNSSEFVTNH
jgi:hypothetical protein